MFNGKGLFLHLELGYETLAEKIGKTFVKSKLGKLDVVSRKLNNHKIKSKQLCAF